MGAYVFMKGCRMYVTHHSQIGSHCMCGPGVKLWDTKNHPFPVSERHARCEFIAHHGLIDGYVAGGGDIVIDDDV